jgi:sulfotransferase
MKAVYDFMSETPFAYDFENVAFDALEFDARLGTPKLHMVGKMVINPESMTILLPGWLAVWGRTRSGATRFEPAWYYYCVGGTERRIDIT